MAASLVVVAADAGLAWLRHRLEKSDRPALPHSMGRARREERPGAGPEYLHGYLLREATLLLKEGRETRRFYSSELTVTSSRIDK
ncbi:MAG: hypothetical protein M3N18_08175 [Actinomycetota bacterium]|nr:hypothetical protein [Actinomycetota bacterium]